MINILLCGVGGQGTVLAAKVLAQAAQSKGWSVRTAETIGMAQRGGNVTSHVRMGNLGESVEAPLIAPGTADVVIAFEPGEAARALSFFAPGAMLITATTPIQPVTAALSGQPYHSQDMLEAIRASLASSAGSSEAASRSMQVIDDEALLQKVGNRKALNTVLLAASVASGALPLSFDELKDSLRVCVKPQFVALNQEAVDVVARETALHHNDTV